MNNNNGFLAQMSKNIILKKKKISVLVLLVFCSWQLLTTTNVQADTLWNSQKGMSDVGKSFGETSGTPRDLRTVVVSGTETFLGFMGIVMVVFVIYGGFMWMTAGGSEDRIKTAKKIIISAAIGATIIMCAYAIVHLVIRVAYNVVTGSVW